MVLCPLMLRDLAAIILTMIDSIPFFPWRIAPHSSCLLGAVQIDWGLVHVGNNGCRHLVWMIVICKTAMSCVCCCIFGSLAGENRERVRVCVCVWL